MSLPDHPVTGPNRQGQGTMGHKVEAGPERVRHRIPRPHTDKMITDQIRSTVYLIDPGRPPPAMPAFPDSHQLANVPCRVARSGLKWDVAIR